jgi:HEPN domain-containing protein
MRVSEAILAVVREWIIKADHDLTMAAHILKLGKDAPPEGLGFHSQQCVEKYLKAILVYRSIPFAKTHVIGDLMNLVPRRYRPTLDKRMQVDLTRYASVTRYPVPGPDISLTAAQKAVTAARRVRREVRQKLPERALPKKKK